MITPGFLQNLIGCSLFLGGAALLGAFTISIYVPCLPSGLGLSILGLMVSPPLRKSCRAFAQAMKDFPRQN